MKVYRFHIRPSLMVSIITILLFFYFLRLRRLSDLEERERAEEENLFTRTRDETTKLITRKTTEDESGREKMQKNYFNIKEKCGLLCKTWTFHLMDNATDSTHRKYFDCPDLLSEEMYDAFAPPEVNKPLRFMPSYSVDDFHYDGRLWKSYDMYNEKDFRSYIKIKPEPEQTWSQSEISDLMKAFKKNDYKMLPMGPNGENHLKNVHRFIQQRFKHTSNKLQNGSRVLVIGSESPYIESLVLAEGATEVYSFSRKKIKSMDPRVIAMQPKEFWSNFNARRIRNFDVIIHFNYLETHGLGRYGETLNPWGDLITMARLWCIMKDNARVFMHIPVGAEGHDVLFYNSMRCYGNVTLPHLFSNWKILDYDIMSSVILGEECAYNLYFLQRLPNSSPQWR